MDYLGWELERQRAALAALLSGGGEARDGETVREGEGRSPEGPGTARGSAGGPDGRYAGGRSGATGGPEDTGGLGDGAPGAWEAVRIAGADRLPGKTAGPVSAWEEIAGVNGPPEQEAGASAGWGQGFRRRGPLSGGTGAQTEPSRPWGGYEAESRETPAGDAAKARAEAAEAAGRNRPGERPAGETGAGGAARQWSGLRRSDVAGAPAAAPLGAEDSARALSRAVQRDARRYDGGFNIY